MTKKIELKRFIQSSGADGALVINKKGELLDALDIEKDGNIAAMTAVAYTMVDELTDDLGTGSIDQIMCKSENGIYIIHKFNDECIVCTHCSDVGKVGYIMMALKAIKL